MTEPHAAELVDVASLGAGIVVDLRYYRADNAFKTKLYASPACLLARTAAERLVQAQGLLRARGFGLKIWDGYRPLSVQRAMWVLLPDERFVAPPERGSLHNRGAAVDVTLVDAAGRELELPSGFDDFSERANRAYKGMSRAARENLDVLEAGMSAAGFLPLPEEWWHYDDPEWASCPLRGG